MSEYQVIARKYRPRSFAEVLGQEAVVTTLKNAIKNKRLAHAYLFCGSRGTGKTTLARIFAKALNCMEPENGEPCGTCSSCKEINAGHSLDVLEIDGASHRGIDDIRQINETVGYSTSSGGYKIYIIDEVHMLTKEAFNALLKTLEEPPPKVKFLFCTTEPHKVLPTILSRCQRFNLNRIPLEKILSKLKRISAEAGLEADEGALRLIAQRAEGGLRDAESLLDQIMAFHEGSITKESVASALGIMPQDCFFALDQAGKEGNLGFAFELAHQLYTQGKDLSHFAESLIIHFRNILLVKLSGPNAPFLNFSEMEKDKYAVSSKLYTQEQCMTILDFLVEAQGQLRFSSNPRIAVEAILLKILRAHQRVPIEYLIKRLTEIEQNLAPASPQPESSFSTPTPPAQQAAIEKKTPPIGFSDQTPAAPPASCTLPPPAAKGMIKEDPTPTAADLGIKEKTKTKPSTAKPKETPPAPIGRPQSEIDTLLQFAAVELEGTLRRNIS